MLNKIKISMRILINILLLGLIVASCSKSKDSLIDPNTEAPLITKLVALYVITPGLFITPGSDPTGQSEITDIKYTTFVYNEKKKLMKRVGMFFNPPGSTGSLIFLDQLYTALTYSKNEVIVEDFSSIPNLEILPNTRRFTLNSSNQIITKIIPGNNDFRLKVQTFNYTDNKLSEIITTFPNRHYDADDPDSYILTYSEKFYYDANGNLDRTEYFEKHDGENNGERIIRTFDDFDNSLNPFRRLQLLDDYFYYSLSRNNYRKYSEVHYYNDNDEQGKISIYEWTYSYDTNGQIIVE